MVSEERGYRIVVFPLQVTFDIFNSQHITRPVSFESTTYTFHFNSITTLEQIPNRKTEQQHNGRLN